MCECDDNNNNFRISFFFVFLISYSHIYSGYDRNIPIFEINMHATIVTKTQTKLRDIFSVGFSVHIMKIIIVNALGCEVLNLWQANVFMIQKSCRIDVADDGDIFKWNSSGR